MTIEASNPTNADYIDALRQRLNRKRDRLRELQSAGRYGYQLRMPLKAIRMAAIAHEAALESYGANPRNPLPPELVPAYRAALREAA